MTNSLAIGGVEKNLVRLTGELTSRGHEVVVAARTGQLTPDVVSAGGSHLELNMVLTHPRCTAGDVAMLRRCIREHHIDLVHVFSASAAILVAVARLTLIPKHHRPMAVASVMGLHNYPDEPTWRVRLRVALLALGARRVIVMAPAIEGVVQSLRLPESRIVRQSVVGVGLPDSGTRDDARRCIRRELGIDDAPLIVTIGRLEPRKSHDLFIRAAARILSDHPRAVCCIVGDGTEEARLRDEIERLGLSANVRMLGNRRDVEALLRASDVCVRPGIVEGFIGITVLEAQALGVPVISFETEDVKLAIDDGRTGLLVPSGDTDALAAAVSRVLDDPDFAARLGAAGRAHMEQTYALPSVVTALEELYTQVAAEGAVR